ncbi:glycoside hydrolase family 16 protein [Periconia macrospinosa]|uniref:Glycoside hydrolase family 16 protein n=1 Tax=Periconia macrospinosa TaxID=97972 RepID=A0A2V1EE54_9PLEO|nr:glycoside hydrolase family 16 protein [Periconia macrospinosa]
MIPMTFTGKPSLGALFYSITVFLHPVLSAQYTTSGSETPHDNTQNCTCYVVGSGANADQPAYFQYYRFFDFRNLADNADQYVQAPPLLNTSQEAASASVWDANILNSDAWKTDWNIQNWSKPATSDFPTPMTNSFANVYIQQNADGGDDFTFLTLRTSRLNDSQTAAEIENEQKNLMHVTMRMHARVVGSKGAVAGFFTFFDDSNESDIEILTRDPKTTIRYTNQPAVDKSGNEVASASVAPQNLASWDQWQTHRIDWLDKNSFWYLNGKEVAANTYSVPRKPSGLTINMWSDGGEWSGNMEQGGSAEFQIQWIEMAFNTSGPVGGPKGKRDVEVLQKRKKSKGCEVVCKIDDVEKMGTPDIVSVNYSMAGSVSVSWGLLAIVTLVSFFTSM